MPPKIKYPRGKFWKFAGFEASIFNHFLIEKEEDEISTRRTYWPSSPNYELSHRKAKFASTWAEYINNAVDRINDRNAKNILLHLSKYSDRTWTHLDFKKELNLDLDPRDILRKLVDLFKADLIEEGTSDIAFQGLQDYSPGTSRYPSR